MEYNCFLELLVIYLIVTKVLGAHKKKTSLRHLQLSQPQILVKIDRGQEFHDGRHKPIRPIQFIRKNFSFIMSS